MRPKLGDMHKEPPSAISNVSPRNTARRASNGRNQVQKISCPKANTIRPNNNVSPAAMNISSARADG